MGVEQVAPDLAAELHTVSERKPSGYVTPLVPFGFSFRREPDAIVFVATGTSLGMSLLLIELAERIPKAATGGYVLSVTFFFATIVCLIRFLSGQLRRLDFVAEGGALVQRTLIASKVLSERRTDVGEVIAVAVVHDVRGVRVVLAGPRHSEIGEIYQGRPLDPDILAPWMAEMVSIVARHASTQSTQSPQSPHTR